jgi:diadenosine tetraphosphate (Ap4A) HIT family hydrolase
LKKVNGDLILVDLNLLARESEEFDAHGVVVGISVKLGGITFHSHIHVKLN